MSGAPGQAGGSLPDRLAGYRLPGRASAFRPGRRAGYARESGHQVLARLLLAQGRPGQSVALLDRLHAAAKAQNRTGSLIETGALRALALAATGDEAGAVTTLAGALLLACPQGHGRVFADEGPPMDALLGRLIAAQRTGRAAAGLPLGYLARLQRAFGPGRPARDPVLPASSTADQPRVRGADDAGGGPCGLLHECALGRL